jgi:hypothetical protein
MPGVGPVEPAALKYQSNSWNVEEVQEWAKREFPKEFQVLPDVGSLKFKDGIDGGNPIPNVKLLRIGKGRWVSRLQRIPTKKTIYAFITGSRSNQIGFIVIDLGHGNVARHVVDNLDDYVDLTGLQGLRYFFRPFRNLGEMVELEYQASMPRFRALILYLFMKAGYIDYVGGYQAYPRDFQLACSWIANGGVRPKCKPLSFRPQQQARVIELTHTKEPSASSCSHEDPGQHGAASSTLFCKADPDTNHDLNQEQRKFKMTWLYLPVFLLLTRSQRSSMQRRKMARRQTSTRPVDT